MTFLWIGLLAVVLTVPALILLYAWSQRRRKPVAARYSSLSLIREAAPARRRWRRHVPFALFAASAAVLVIALARPVVVLSVPSNQTTILLAMDVSGSMCSTDIDPTRLQAAEEAAVAFVNAQASDTQIGIVAFSGFAAVIQPPTSDRQALVDAIRSLTTGRRTAIGSGILAAIDAISEIDPNVAPSIIDGRPGVAPTPVTPGAYAPDIIVLLTDGANNAGVDPLDAAQQAADRGVRVYTIGFGTAAGGGMQAQCRRQFMGNEPFGAGGGQGGGQGGFGGGGGNSGGGGNNGGGQGNPGGFRRGIDEATLKAIAAATGGTYAPAESAGDLQAVFAALPTRLITKHEPVEVSVAFVALGGLLCAASLLLGRAWRPIP
jgi:Ca-activated chloride channel homolog